MSEPHPTSTLRGADPDDTLPEDMLAHITGPSVEIVFPSADGEDASLAHLFPHGVVLVDFRAYAPAVLFA